MTWGPFATVSTWTRSVPRRSSFRTVSAALRGPITLTIAFTERCSTVSRSSMPESASMV